MPKHTWDATDKGNLRCSNSTRVAIVFLTLCIVSAVGFAQSTSVTRLYFEVSTIKRNVSTENQSFSRLPGGRLHVVNTLLRNLILLAYDFSPDQLGGAPDWFGSEHYDIDAKAEGNPTKEEMMGMLQVLLEDRFQLRVHRETKELPLYILSIAKGGPKLQQSKPGGCVDRGAATPATAPTDQQGRGFCGSSIVSNGQWNASKIDMASFTRILSSMLPRKAVDRTGLTGSFDIHLDLPPNPLDTTEATGPSIFTVLQEQLGLKLEAGKVPTEVLLIDRVERPSEN